MGILKSLFIQNRFLWKPKQRAKIKNDYTKQCVGVKAFKYIMLPLIGLEGVSKKNSVSGHV